MKPKIKPIHSLKKEYNTRNIVTIARYPHLKNLFDAHEFEKFCVEYSKSFKLNKYLPFAVENFNSMALDESLKYIAFILEKQGRAFDTTYIGYLLEKKLTIKVIDFFDSIKNVKDKSLCPEMISGESYLKILNDTQDGSLLVYALNYPVNSISALSNKSFIYGEIIEKGFHYLLKLFHANVQNVHLFAMDELFNTQDQSKVYAALDLLNVKDPAYLKHLISQYIADNPVPQPKDYTIVRLAVHQHDAISKTIWSKYCVTLNMVDKEEVAQKTRKI